MLVLLLPASESSCLWSLHCKWVQSQWSLWPPLGGIYPTPPPLLQVGVSAWMAYWSEWDSTNTGGVCGGEVFVCARMCVCKCESDCVSSRRRGVGMQGGTLNLKRREGPVQRDRDKRVWTPNYADINAEPKVPERGSAESVYTVMK